MTESTETPQEPAAWWREQLNRRDAGKRAAAAALVAAGAGTLWAGCNRKSASADITEADSIALQREHGWDVGFSGELVSIPGSTTTDSSGGEAWREFVSPDRLMAMTRPNDEAWRSHESPALFQSLSQEGLSSAITPMHVDSMDAAHGRGQALGELVDASENPNETLIVIDLPGPLAVAAAAGMAHVAEPVFWFDNWPHPRGVVASHQTLASTLYYAKAFEDAGALRPAQHAKVLVLDANRLEAYADGAAQFDNRYMADLPDPAQLTALGITKLLYVRPSRTSEDLDDVNEPLAEISQADTTVQMLTMDVFQPASEGGKPDENAAGQYYYGGSQESHTHYYRHYPMFLWIPGPRYGYMRPATGSASRVRSPRSSWRPAPRATMFSGRSAGGASGVGRARPTGFGRVSHRVDSSGRVSGVRSGPSRSGSQTRVSGRTSSG
ncbi:MAG: hypothetical protein ACJA1R_000399 [Flavobacteriales bacterium]